MPAVNSDTRNMKGLLALVIIMGVLIVIGSVVVVVTIANRMSGSKDDVAESKAVVFGTADLPVPAGCQVIETVATDDRLILRLGSGERCNQLLIVDLASGRHLGTVRLTPQ
jgi:hypothetical protein